MSPDRKNRPVNRPDIVPVIYQDSRARRALADVKSPEGIDEFIRILRKSFFPRWLGYEPPLILVHPYLPKIMAEAQGSGLLTPDNYASAMWNHGFLHYPGVVNNLQASFVPFDAHLAQTQQEYVHRLSAVTFMVKGEMHSETGALEGEARRRYVLFLNHLGIPNNLPRRLLSQGLTFYSPEELWNKRAVLMSTAVENNHEVKRVIHEANERVYSSSMVAKAVERKGIIHPLQGGLPGLGKSS
ncbi:hypothetical protein HY025_04785 [Candidatus Daviesbacteria bacterium]|nr:hypothetical protein [Candidatus Daviesbacteria bacterium]